MRFLVRGPSSLPGCAGGLHRIQTGPPTQPCSRVLGTSPLGAKTRAWRAFRPDDGIRVRADHIQPASCPGFCRSSFLPFPFQGNVRSGPPALRTSSHAPESASALGIPLEMVTRLSRSSGWKQLPLLAPMHVGPTHHLQAGSVPAPELGRGRGGDQAPVSMLAIRPGTTLRPHVSLHTRISPSALLLGSTAFWKFPARGGRQAMERRDPNMAS